METNSKNVFWLFKKTEIWHFYCAYKYVLTCKSWDANLLLKNSTKMTNFRCMYTKRQSAHGSKICHFCMIFSSLSLHPNFCT
jgi:hypothetical protein